MPQIVRGDEERLRSLIMRLIENSHNRHLVTLNTVNPIKIFFYFSSAIEADNEIDSDDLNGENEHLKTWLVFKIIDCGKYLNSR